jgi:predicted ester cyclase
MGKPQKQLIGISKTTDRHKSILAADYFFYNPNNPDVRNRKAYKQYVTIYRTAFSDIHFTVENLIAEGDKE